MPLLELEMPPEILKRSGTSLVVTPFSCWREPDSWHLRNYELKVRSKKWLEISPDSKRNTPAVDKQKWLA
jgi:hypothetical protein